MELFEGFLQTALSFSVDFFLLMIFVLTIILHLKKSVIRSVHELLALIAATFVAKVYSWPLGSIIMRETSLFTNPNRRAKAILLSTIAIFIIVFLLVNVLLSLVEKLFKMNEMKMAENMIFTIILGAILGFFYVGAVVLIIKVFEMSQFEPVTNLTSTSYIITFFTKILSLYFPHVAVLITGG